jgi:hypothetical protein
MAVLEKQSAEKIILFVTENGKVTGGWRKLHNKEHQFIFFTKQCKAD